ncbi:hypothetical protein [Desulfobacter latus]|uniref:IPT/TIG domain-containing protein n=1 Tax=Desulfobacter latus TaxID=2292 RepID=A0A850T9Y5_9BACT|nr:hypothetical protein [Desulfobacter latus]NWH06125.1 hypothetical protein [Desulfobacter latus]
MSCNRFNNPVLKKMGFNISVISVICLISIAWAGTVQALSLEACKRYASESVRQNEQNKALKAGFTGPAWSSNYDSHFNWCKQGNNLTTTPGHLANREKALQAFAIKSELNAPKRYANEAVRQYKESQFMGAEFPPPVWSDNYREHYNWSRRPNNLVTTPDHLANRERVLQEYAITYNKGPSKYTTVPVVKMAEIGTRKKNLNRLSPIQHFEQLQQISKGPDPVIAAFMHTLQKHLAGGSNYSQIEQIMLKGIKELSQVRQKQLLNKWHSLPTHVRLAATPKSIQNLSPHSRLEMSAFTDSLVETAAFSGKVKEMKPILLNNSALNSNLSALSANQNLVSNAPQVTDFAPRGPDGPFLRIGESFTLFGVNFGTDARKTKIHFMQKENGKYIHVGTVYPQSLKNTKLSSTAIAPGLYASNRATRIIVEADGKFSAPYPITLAAALKPTPKIVSVEPGAQLPGNMVLVTGENMGSPLYGFMEAMDQKASAYRPKGINFNINPTVLNSTQCEFIIPQNVWSGNYKFNLKADNSGYSNYKTFKVLPAQYRVEFTKMKCRDEQNPEAGGSDELVTAWVIIADNLAWAKGTGEYGGFDDNTVKNYSAEDSTIVPAEVKAWQTVEDFLYFRTTLYEWDDGDINAWSKGVKTVGEIAPAVGSALGAIFSNPEAGKVAGEIVKVIGDGLSKLLSWINNDPDLLGSEARTWTAPELQELTSKSIVYTDRQLFLNDGDTGSYSLDFRIVRK